MNGLTNHRHWRLSLGLLALAAGCAKPSSPGAGPGAVPVAAPGAAPARYVEALAASGKPGTGVRVWSYRYGGGPVVCEVVMEEREDDSNRKLSPGYVPSETKRTVLLEADPPAGAAAPDGEVVITLAPLADGPNQCRLTVENRPQGHDPVKREVDLPGPHAAGGHGLDRIETPGENFPNLRFFPAPNGERMLIAFNWFKPPSPDHPGGEAAEAPKEKAKAKGKAQAPPKVLAVCTVKAVFPVKPATP